MDMPGDRWLRCITTGVLVLTGDGYHPGPPTAVAVLGALRSPGCARATPRPANRTRRGPPPRRAANLMHANGFVRSNG